MVPAAPAPGGLPMSRWKFAGALLIGAALAAASAVTPAAEPERLPPHGVGGKAGPKVGPKAGPVNKKTDIAVDGDKVTINGTKLTLPIEKTDLIAALGRPDRTDVPSTPSNTILTWDDLGVYAYFPPNSTSTNALAFTFGAGPSPFWPKKNYGGKLSLEGVALNALSTVEELNDEPRKGGQFVKNMYLDGTWDAYCADRSVRYFARMGTAGGERLVKLEVVQVGKPVPKKLTVAIDGGTIAVNGGKPLALMFDSKELVAALGKPDREADLANVIMTWDNHGLFAYVKPKTNRVHAIAIALDRDTNLSFWPKKDFSGKVTVDGAEVKASSSIAAINKLKKGLPFEKNEFLTDSWSFKDTKGSVYLRKGEDGFVALEVGVLPD
jgi:hypothetical protein